MLQPAANGWTKSTWADEEATRDRIFQTDSYRARFIRAWAEDAAAGHLLVKDDQLQNWLCDIDTNTGRLVPPVQYGETMADLTKLKNKEHAWRRLNWTSNLLAHKKFERRGLINNTNGVEDGLMGTGENVQPAQLYAWEQPADTVTTPVIRETEIIQHPDEPKVACYLRPAIKSDMEGVMKIYNHEVAHGLQALDTEPLVVQDLEDLLKRNREMKMPFLVMVKGKYGGESHAPPARDEILGFSFLSVSQTGLTGSEKNTKSHMSARAHVYVHHEYRQKKIGFSLLDKLLSVVSTRYSTKRGCDFHDATDDPVYDSGTLYNKPRLFFKIYIQYMVRTKVPQKPGLADKEELDEDLGWVRRMLLDLRFVQKGRFEGIHRVPCRGDQLAIFLDAVVFEHECDDLVNMPTFPTKNTLI
ncbi:hypothetical protein P8C59_000396 [Phyllachora maydis]|uniref:N-acetyltransferase domain-containing protein n=1 Tax=Phyllachora maydis TaxID=1825666 RepID=A0AAD9HW77_9PEZI|nr:hypothetical protein P8C59_000396 [Phyllachora maydis]